MADCKAKGRTASGRELGRRIMASKVASGNVVQGERSGTAKLTDEAVREIRSRVASGETMISIYRSYGISYAQIRNIVSRRAWRHVA